MLNEVKKNSNSIVNDEQKPGAFEKKNEITPSFHKNFEVFNTIDDFLRYLEKTRKVLIEYSIKNDVSIDEFKDSYIKMHISQNLAQDFILNLHKLLEDTTGKKWEIDIIRGEIGETIADKEKTKVEAKTKNVAEYPLVKKILEEFKGAKIETIIRKNIQVLAPSEPDEFTSDMSITYTETEED